MKYYSLSEAAKKLNKSRQWIWVLIQMNRIKAEKIGNQFVITEEELRNHLSKAQNNN